MQKWRSGNKTLCRNRSAERAIERPPYAIPIVMKKRGGSQKRERRGAFGDKYRRTQRERRAHRETRTKGEPGSSRYNHLLECADRPAPTGSAARASTAFSKSVTTSMFSDARSSFAQLASCSC